MSNPSRFNRTRSAEDEATVSPTPSEPQRPTVSRTVSAPPYTSQNVPTQSAQDLTALQNRLVRVQRERLQRELELNNTEKAIQECEAAAKKLGINSLEEMEAFVKQLEAEDIAAQERFAQELESEEALLQRISQQLADLERE